jgi:hypothetical protein
MKRSGVSVVASSLSLVSCLVTFVPSVAADGHGDVIAALAKSPSPVILAGNAKLAFRDPAALFHDGSCYLFYTLSENDDDGGYHNMTAVSVSRDLAHWSPPRILTPRDRHLNYSSPGNVVRIGDEWILCLQSYPTPNKETFGTGNSRLFIMRSKDLAEWSEPELLRVKGNDVPVEAMGRMIDPYLLEDKDEPGKFINQVGGRREWMSKNGDLSVSNVNVAPQSGFPPPELVREKHAMSVERG